MIDIVIKAPGTYQYGWDRYESGWSDARESLHPFADYTPPGDDVDAMLVWDGMRGTDLTFYVKLSGDEIVLPVELIKALMGMTITTLVDGKTKSFAGVTVEAGKDSWGDKFAKVVANYVVEVPQT